jgi:hypothetical protein
MWNDNASFVETGELDLGTSFKSLIIEMNYDKYGATFFLVVGEERLFLFE